MPPDGYDPYSPYPPRPSYSAEEYLGCEVQSRDTILPSVWGLVQGVKNEQLWVLWPGGFDTLVSLHANIRVLRPELEDA